MQTTYSSTLLENGHMRTFLRIFIVVLTMLAVLIILIIGFDVSRLSLPFGNAAPLNFSVFTVDPYHDKPRITYRPDGTFKLTVFSDLHYGEGEETTWGPEADRSSDSVMRKILKIDRPDFVVINGDLITGESRWKVTILWKGSLTQEVTIVADTFKENATLYVDRLLQPLIDARVPFSSTYGNHDNQANVSHFQEMEREVKITTLSYTRRGPINVGGEGGEINYWVPVYADKHVPNPSLILWFFDSRGGFSSAPNSTRLPDWVDRSVAKWIEEESIKMDSAWGPALKTGRQALAFAHIPPSFLKDLQGSLNSAAEPGLNADELGVGSVQSSNEGAVGEDLPWWNAVREHIPNLHATVHGHDHGNEWCIRDPQSDIILCFDKHTGYGGYGSPGWGYGVRTFEFKLNDTTARTFIRMEDGSTHAEVTLDSHYGRA